MTPTEVRAFEPLVKACARRYTPSSLPASLDPDDLEAVCWHALVEAEAVFDASLGVPLANWAWIRMRGAVLDEIRQQRFGKRAAERGELGEPTQFEERDGDRGRSVASAEAALDARELLAAVAALPERERTVIVARLNGRLNEEIGVELGVSASRVSQLNSEARCRLRNQVAA